MLVLFDLDGTLLLTRGAGLEAVVAACRELFGEHFVHRTTSVDGSLDPVIWRELCAENAIADPDAHHDRFRALYAGRLARVLAEPGRAYALRGARELVAALQDEPDLTVGVLTGNYPETGKLKLAAAGFDPDRFSVAAWGSDARTRPGLVPVARARHRERSGIDLAPDRVVIVGDTPSDVRCAKENGARCLAVATGRYSTARLAFEGADLALEDLSDTHTARRWIVDRASLSR